MAALVWIPPLAWMALIFVGSTEIFSSEATSRVILPLLRWAFPGAHPAQLAFLHLLLRKAGHALEYAILASLWFRALSLSGIIGSRRSHAGVAWAVAAAYAILDELHQGWTDVRTASALDVAVDWSGSAAAALLLTLGWRRLARGLTTSLLWIAAAGGTVFLFFHLLSGIPPGWLWFTTPAAWVMLWAWRRWG
ncbi:MAG: VanZ family protein [Candidatus Methylomirabilia bacterium]